MSWREQMQFAKEHGLCARCFTNEAPYWQAVCMACVKDMAADKQRAREQGLCVNCWKNLARENRLLCQECQDRRSEAQSQRYKARTATGLCGRCGKMPAWGGRTICAYCWRKRHGI